MTEKEYRETIKRLNEINEQQFITILDLSSKLRETEELLKVKRVQKI